MPETATDSILAKLVAAGGFLSAEAVEAARARAGREGVPLRDVLLREGVAPEVLASLEVAARSASSTTQARPPASDATIIAPASGPAATVLSPSGTNLPRRAPGKLTHVGKYEILGEIGRGGMGVVFKARHPGLDRVVALKMLIATGDPEHVERFQREARSAARMGKHPNLVQVHDVGEENGSFYFTMEFVEGQGFDREIHVDKPAPRRVAEVVEQVARGLAQAHSEGVIHRDLKPSNVIVDATGRPLLTDFGLAKEVGTGSSVSVAGQVLGTPAYMSPEQAEGQLDRVNERSDVYGLGTVLYEGLTRKAPFEGAGNIEILRKVTGVDPVPPARLNPAVPRDLDVICLECFAKNPADRYESAAALADDLQRFLDGEPILARPVPWGVRVARRARKNLLLVSVGAVAAALLVTGSILTVRLMRERADKQRERTRVQAEKERERVRIETAARVAEEKRVRVAEAVGRGRAALEKGEKAMRPDVVALSGQAAEAAVFEATVKELDGALAEDAANAEARRLRARALRLARKPREAVEEAGRALAARPGDVEALTEKTLANLDLLRMAMGHLSMHTVPGLASLGSMTTRRVYVKTDPSAKALREQVSADIETVTKSGISAGMAAFFRGMLLALDEKVNDEGALREFDAAIAADPTLVEAYRNRAFVLARMGRPEALQAYRDLVRAQPFDAELQAELAGLELTREAIVSAIDAAVKLAPGSAWVWQQRGLIRLWLNDEDGAAADYTRALELDPESSGALYGLFSLRESCGDYLAADPLLDSWKKLAPPDPLLWWEAGGYYRTTCRHDLALPCFQRALDLDPGYPLYLWARGRSRLMVGQYVDGAKDMFDAVGAGDLEGNTRKMYDSLRAKLEKQVAGMSKPGEVAKFAENLAAFLKLAQSLTSSDDRKRQYASSIDNLMIIASELYTQSEDYGKARETLLACHWDARWWGQEYTLARIAALAYDKPAAFEHLRKAKALGMTSLGAARTDAGFFRLKDCDEWPGYVAEHEQK